jgi:hypothetical protein
LTRFLPEKVKIPCNSNQVSNSANNKAFIPYNTNPATWRSAVAMDDCSRHIRQPRRQNSTFKTGLIIPSTVTIYGIKVWQSIRLALKPLSKKYGNCWLRRRSCRRLCVLLLTVLIVLVQLLANRLSLNSRNSSKPPSTDRFNKDDKANNDDGNQ